MKLIDPDSTKSLEQRVTEAFLRKLYYKVDYEQNFIPKEEFIQLILKDIIVIAKAEYDIDKALKIALKEQPDYKDAPATKRNELVEAAEQYAIEVDAYYHYLDSKKERSEDDSIYDEVFFILNSDDELVSKKLHEVKSRKWMTLNLTAIV